MITPIQQLDHPGDPIFEGPEGNSTYDAKVFFGDFLQCAWRPTEHEATLLRFEEPFSPDEMRTGVNSDGDPLITEEGRKNWGPEDGINPPRQACKKKTITGTDRRPVALINQHARSIRLFSATLSKGQKQFYNETIDQLKFVNVPPDKDRRVSSISILALEETPEIRFWKRYPGNELHHKTLYFHDTKTKTKNL